MAGPITGPYRAMQILIKHQQSARLASWRDPDGEAIKARTQVDAMDRLSTLRGELQALSRDATTLCVQDIIAGLAKIHAREQLPQPLLFLLLP